MCVLTLKQYGLPVLDFQTFTHAERTLKVDNRQSYSCIVLTLSSMINTCCYTHVHVDGNMHVYVDRNMHVHVDGNAHALKWTLRITQLSLLD